MYFLSGRERARQKDDKITIRTIVPDYIFIHLIISFEVVLSVLFNVSYSRNLTVGEKSLTRTQVERKVIGPDCEQKCFTPAVSPDCVGGNTCRQENVIA